MVAGGIGVTHQQATAGSSANAAAVHLRRRRPSTGCSFSHALQRHQRFCLNISSNFSDGRHAPSGDFRDMQLVLAVRLAASATAWLQRERCSSSSSTTATCPLGLVPRCMHMQTAAEILTFVDSDTQRCMHVQQQQRQFFGYTRLAARA